MLGAQARAAEYYAAKNASARQASREAEEQKLPPKSAPVSLSAFTKNVQVNRNKGNKSWVPLVLEEAEEEVGIGISQSTPTPIQPRILKPDFAPLTSDSDDSKSSGKPRVHLPRNGIPTAPRSMISRMQAAAQQGQPSSFIHHNPFVYQTGTPGKAQTQHSTDATGQAVDHMSQDVTPYGRIMVPSDITPSKQEERLFMLSQMQPNPLYGYADPYYPAMDQTALPSTNLAYSPQDADNQTQMFPPSMLTRQSTFQLSPETTPPQTAIFAPDAPLTLPHHRSHPDQDLAEDLRPVAKVQILRPESGRVPKPSKTEEPYDRASKIQRFVEEQQAMARSGKTVLNHSGIRKSQEEQQEKQNSELDKAVTPVKATKPADDLPPELLPSSSAPNKPPGLASPAFRFHLDNLKEQEPEARSSTDTAWREFFGVDNPDWLDLKPATKEVQNKMRFVMQHVALKMFSRHNAPLFPDSESGDAEGEGCFHADQSRFRKVSHSDAMKWFHGDDHMLRTVRNSAVKQDEGTSDSEGWDNQRGLFAEAGLADLTKYLGDNEPGIRDYLKGTKSVSPLVLDGGGLGADLGSISYLDGNKTGFSNVSKKMGWKPQYRPFSEDDIARSEEDWSHRDRTARQYVSNF